MTRTKWTYELVKEYFENHGCKLLSTEYKRSKEKLKYICSCGNVADIAFDKFRQGQRCAACKHSRISEKQRHSYEYVRKYFEDQGCELLSSEYENNHEKLRYRCSCGNVAFITFAKFKAGQRCKKCKNRNLSDKFRGDKSPNWDNEMTQEQRIKDRKYPEYTEWRRKVFERDEYTCQICGTHGGKLNAHHIQSYAKFPELRTDVSNGITLCTDCHKEYHRKIEHNTATLDGWIYYTTEFLEPPFAGEVEDDAYYEYLQSRGCLLG